MLVLKGFFGSVFQWALIAAILIVPAGVFAGEWGWVRGWQYMAVYAAMLFPSAVAMALFAPASLEARMRTSSSGEQPRDDKIASAILFTALPLYMIFLPLDALVWKLLGTPSNAVSLAGLVVSALGYLFVAWTIFTNSYAIPVVEDQSGAGQVLIETGPYALVRHPMYLGMVLMFAGMGLWLGSLASLALTLVPIAAFVLRIRAEAKTLLATLPGYREFRERRRYRLFPLVW